MKTRTARPEFTRREASRLRAGYAAQERLDMAELAAGTPVRATVATPPASSPQPWFLENALAQQAAAEREGTVDAWAHAASRWTVAAFNACDGWRTHDAAAHADYTARATAAHARADALATS